MKDNSMNRRDFIKICMTATAAISTLSYKNLFPRTDSNPYDPKGLPTRILGKTGVSVPLIAIGGGSRFCTIKDPEKSTELLHYALDHGFYYWDTAHDYAYENVISEERYGMALENRRDEVFLSTKVQKRTYDEAMRHVEESLKRLKTDRIDLYQIHSVESMEDVEMIGAENGVLKVLQKLKDEKVTRFIGYSGHRSAQAMAEMARRYDFDTMLIALNHYQEREGDFENQAIPEAAKRNMGILAMKVVRPREKEKSITPEELIRYGLTLPHVDAAVIGTDSLDVLKKNIDLVKDFTPMAQEEVKRISVLLRPFFESQELAWMQPNYKDGIWV
jgi:aryl-alcohol dehydrogenase-like predicted oxidoreductase